MTAWHNDPALKTEVITRMTAHRDQDEIIRGNYQIADPDTAAGYKGCLIGCTLPRIGGQGPDEGWHERVETLYGIPAPIGYLLDRTFENLPNGDHRDFAINSLTAIPVGADLGMVTSRLMLDVLADPEHGVHLFTGEGTVQRAAVERVAGLYVKRLAGQEPTLTEWRDARNAAYDARRAAYAAAYAADAAAYAADAAAYAAVDADAAAAAADDHSTYEAVYARLKPIYLERFTLRFAPVRAANLDAAIALVVRMSEMGK